MASVDVELAVIKKDIQILRDGLKDIEYSLQKLNDYNDASNREQISVRTKAVILAVSTLIAVLGWIALQVIEKRGIL
jgi:hypothetical protein